MNSEKTTLRIGYTSPLLITEVFIQEFYRMVPSNVSLAISTLALLQITEQEFAESNAKSEALVAEMAKAGVDVVVLGGAPLNVALGGSDALQALIERLSKDSGCPVTSSYTAQAHAFRAVEAQRVVVIQPLEPSLAHHFDFAKGMGVDIVGFVHGQARTTTDLATIPSSVALDAGRRAAREHPEADVLYFPGPHWAVSEAIQPLESELGVTVVGAAQAIVWESLRLAGHQGPIENYGALLRC